MLFMVIERFRDNDMVPIYQRLRDEGRSLPDGLEYVDSWVEPNFARCFQLMRCDDLRLFQEWVLQWRGSGAMLEIVPVVPSKETREVVAPHLDPPVQNSNETYRPREASMLTDRLPRYRPLIEAELRVTSARPGRTLGLDAVSPRLGGQRGLACALGRRQATAPPPSCSPPSWQAPGRGAAAAAIELVHNFSLLHDDIDEASERRHDRATLWTLTGVPQAINTGDGMHVLARLAILRLAERGYEAATVLAAAHELDRACLQLVQGQHADIAMEGRSHVTRADYLAMIEGKTAAMFGVSFALGALLSGADARTIAAFRDFGRHAGMPSGRR
jgi:hypothetical protein